MRIYYTVGNVLMSARLTQTPTMRVVARDTVVTSALVSLNAGAAALTANYDVARDGRLLGLLYNKNDFQLVIVPNWLPEMQQRMTKTKRK